MRKQVHPRLTAGRMRTGPYGSDDAAGHNGAFQLQLITGDIRIIASDGTDSGAKGWEHVSVSCPGRCPSWYEMAMVKNLFWDEDECVVQFHPPKSEYVNNHPYVLHMWRHKVYEFPMPPSILVGIKDDGTYANAEEAEAGYQRAKKRGDIA